MPGANLKNMKAANQIEKVVLNVGVGKMSQQGDFENKFLPEIMKELAMITGQKGMIIKSKKAISGFKLKANQIVGIKTTLRRKKAVDFLERLINIVLPRIKDFRGLSPKTISESGVLNLGIRDKAIWPEIIPEESKVAFGLEINIIPKTRNRKEAMELYSLLKMPIKKDK